MEGEALASRPESPKKKIKSNPISDSEAQPSNSSESNRNIENNEDHGHNSPTINGIAPTRRRVTATRPDSSSECSSRDDVENSPPRIQEEEVSSSENAVVKVKEPEDLAAVCDSASSDISDRH